LYGGAFGNNGADSGGLRWYARYAMWNGVPAPANVTSFCASDGGVACASKPSVTIIVQPKASALKMYTAPATWVKGNTQPMRSASVTSSRSHMPTAAALMVASVCCAPLGSAVVPDV